MKVEVPVSLDVCLPSPSIILLREDLISVEGNPANPTYVIPYIQPLKSKFNNNEWITSIPPNDKYFRYFKLPADAATLLFSAAMAARQKLLAQTKATHALLVYDNGKLYMVPYTVKGKWAIFKL